MIAKTKRDPKILRTGREFSRNAPCARFAFAIFENDFLRVSRNPILSYIVVVVVVVVVAQPTHSSADDSQQQHPPTHKCHKTHPPILGSPSLPRDAPLRAVGLGYER